MATTQQGTEQASGRGAERARFVGAHHQLQSLVEWLARMQASFDPERPIRLGWDGRRRIIETGPLGGALTVTLHLPDLVLQFLEDGRAVNHPFEAEDHTPAHVEAWLLVEMLHRGVDRSRFSKALPYDVSRLMSGDSEEFSPVDHASELDAVTTLLRDASELLLEAGGLGAVARLRTDDFGLEVERVGQDIIGFTPCAGPVAEPFFYVRRQGLADMILAVSRFDLLKDVAQIMDFLGKPRVT